MWTAMCGRSFVFGFCCRLHVFDPCQVKRLTYFTRHSAHPPAPPSGESVRVLCRLRTLQSRVTGHRATAACFVSAHRARGARAAGSALAASPRHGPDRFVGCRYPNWKACLSIYVLERRYPAAAAPEGLSHVEPSSFPVKSESCGVGLSFFMRAAMRSRGGIGPRSAFFGGSAK